MINIENYDTTFSIKNSIVQYLFESSGQKKLIKGVQYSKFETKSGETVYNLGFGDYDSETKGIFDRKSSNNGDARKVFNTVLNTIPKFLKEFPDFPIFIQGSDSHNSFEEECRSSCSKNCNIICKNKDRRIRTYIHFLDKKIKVFSKDYTFYGFDEKKKTFVEYEPKNKYTAILVYKKK
ncbi:DUF6934 family protein [Flavobacterium pectinovorum]|uniref:Uncharacterized protein n=1 Tax=Flavobacterium pectinovorum TaxID=29533 RepID=A0ABY1IZJ2_9FLAO|nr:hypothetical protein [Flavobacterium pectinovorum]SHL56357.1 hypothetical protein SAMN05444387_0922 [Flavobacterium pectinovorum]